MASPTPSVSSRKTIFAVAGVVDFLDVDVRHRFAIALAVRKQLESLCGLVVTDQAMAFAGKPENPRLVLDHGADVVGGQGTGVVRIVQQAANRVRLLVDARQALVRRHPDDAVAIFKHATNLVSGQRVGVVCLVTVVSEFAFAAVVGTQSAGCAKPQQTVPILDDRRGGQQKDVSR